MVKIIFILIISSLLVFSQLQKEYIVLEISEYIVGIHYCDFTNGPSRTFTILKELKSDTLFALLIDENINPNYRKIKKNDTLKLNLKLKKFYDSNLDLIHNFLFSKLPYNNFLILTFIDDNVKSGYLPDSCFINNETIESD